MPRPKLIYHGTDDMGEPRWAPPTDDYRACPHPPPALRFYPRQAVPFWMYCRACGMFPIHPDHVWWRHSPEEKAEAQQRARKRADELLKIFGSDG